MSTINFSETKESDYFFYWGKLKDRNEMEEIIKTDTKGGCYLAELKEPTFDVEELLEDYLWNNYDEDYYTNLLDGISLAIDKFNRKVNSMLKIYPYYESTRTLVNLEK